ncbi:MAG: MFS transporter [Christensenellaceae bacterium]|nr:MFS transporter [Christensenellaceae bacterium]
MKTQKNRHLLLLCVALFWAAQHIFTPYQTPYMTAMGILADTAGIIVGAYGFTQMLLRFPIGVNADRKAKHKPFIAAGFLCIMGASILRLFASSAPLFLAANLLAGVGSSMWISFTILFSNMYSEDELRSSISLVFSFNQLGMLAAYMVGILIYPIDAKYIFITSIALSLTGLVLSFFVKEDAPSGNGKADIRKIIKDAISKRLVLFSVLAIITQAAAQATQSSFTSQVAKELGADSTQLGILSIITMGSAFLGSSLLRTKFLKNAPIHLLITVCASLYAGYCLMVGFAGSVLTVFIAQFFGGMANAQLGSLFMSSAIEGCPAASKSTAMGFYQAVYGFGMTIGPVIMGFAAENFSYTAGFGIMAVLIMLDVALYYIFRKKI